MLNFSFCSPTYFEFGKGAEKEVGALVKRFGTGAPGAGKTLLHYGGGSIKKSGLYDTVVASLRENGVEFVELGGAQPNPVSSLVYEGIELCRKENVDFVLAVGGGSAIDSAKAIAAGAVYDGDFWDFFQGRYVEKALPVGVILTIAAAGSEGSPNSVITNDKTLEKRGCSGEVIRPVFSILNPELTQTLPPEQTAAGAADIMVHVIERYFSNTKEVEITDRICEAVLKTMIYETPRAIENPNNYAARANIMWAGMVAHNNLCGVGREQDWVSHGMAHEPSAFYGATHGAALAVICPAWMKFVSRVNPDKFVQFAVRVWDCQMNFEHPEITAREGIERFELFLKKIGMPSSLKEFGAKEEDIPKFARHIGRVGETEKNFGGYVKLNLNDVEEIYKLAFL
ncbi:MAG: iron-containing alcohol dehydrogenase [Oscillospiraceae bacterium]|nr:iron-containing alcohol dehydrogenase [Oscillospiraceae bacterium]